MAKEKMPTFHLFFPVGKKSFMANASFVFFETMEQSTSMATPLLPEKPRRKNVQRAFAATMLGWSPMPLPQFP